MPNHIKPLCSRLNTYRGLWRM